MIKNAYYNGITKKAATAWKRSLRASNIKRSFDDARRAMNRMHQIQQYNNKLNARPQPILKRPFDHADVYKLNRVMPLLRRAGNDMGIWNGSSRAILQLLPKYPQRIGRIKNPYIRNKVLQYVQYQNNPGYLTLPRTMSETNILSDVMSRARKKFPWIPEDKIRDRILKTDILAEDKNPYATITDAWDNRLKTADEFLQAPQFLRTLE